MNYFAKNIRYLRKIHNMSQNELADKLGYKSFTTIQKWESNDSEPTLSTLSKLGAIFNIKLTDLCEHDLEDNNRYHNTQSEQRLLNNYNSTTDKGKNRIMTTSEEMVELYPIIDRDEMLDYLIKNGIQEAALYGKNINDLSDEQLAFIYKNLREDE